MSETNPQFSFLSVCTYCEIREGDIQDACTKALEIDSPDGLLNRDVYFDSDDPEEFEVIYSNEIPEVPSQSDLSRSAMEINYSEDRNSLHVHSWSRPEFKDNILETHRELLQNYDEVEVVHLNVLKIFDKSLSALGFELDSDSETENNSEIYSAKITTDSGPINLTAFYDGSVASVSPIEEEIISNDEFIETVEESIGVAIEGMKEIKVL